MTGKQKCEILRRIRMTIAAENGIEYPFEPCTHVGNCPGTCPACEAELQWLTEELVKRQKDGQQIKMIGIFVIDPDDMMKRLECTCEQMYTYSIDNEYLGMEEKAARMFF